MSGRFTLEIEHPDGGVQIVRRRNVIALQGAAEVLRRALTDAFHSGISLNSMGLYTAGSVTSGSTAAALGVTEFEGYESNVATERIRLTLNSIAYVPALGAVRVQWDTSSAGPARVTAGGLLKGAFIINGINFGSGTALWCGVDFPQPVLAVPGALIRAAYDFTATL